MKTVMMVTGQIVISTLAAVVIEIIGMAIVPNLPITTGFVAGVVFVHINNYLMEAYK